MCVWVCPANHELDCHPEPSVPLEVPWKELETGGCSTRERTWILGTVEQSEKGLEQCLPQWPWGGEVGKRAGKRWGQPRSQQAETTQSRDRHFLRHGVVCTHTHPEGQGGEVSYMHFTQEESEALRADRTYCVLTSHTRILMQVCVAQKSMRNEGSWVLLATYKLGNLGKSPHLSYLSLPICKM